jgi:DNA polymerase-3 subunit alpha
LNGVREATALRIWKQLVTAGAYAFNAAHCVSYGMLAYWTMWLKVNHPLEFYCAALQKYDPKTKGFDLLKEASARGISVLPPDPAVSELSWSIEGDGLRAGFLQVSGIGEVTAEAILKHRATHYSEGLPMEWANLAEVRGIGPKTIEKIKEFAEEEDPFGIHLLSRTLAEVRRYLFERGDDLGLPFPRHKSDDIPYEPSRGEFYWLGMVRERNLKDLYELHRSRTGEELDPATVKEPEHVNWMVITGEDETGPLVITVHRYGGFYERVKDRLWNMDIKNQLLLVVGHKRNEYRRAIYASQLFVIDPSETGRSLPLYEQDY